MTCYVVAFEVHTREREQKLVEAMKKYDGYCPINGNCWAILTDQDSVGVRDTLMKPLESPDMLFVIKSGVEAAWSDIYGDANAEWLRNNL